LIEGLAITAGDGEKAQSLLVKATALASQSHLVSLNLADLYLHRGELLTALEWINRSIALDPTDPDAYRLAITIAQLAGDATIVDEFKHAAKSRFPAQVW
jgi:Tfp pilus assembly protein PilF